MENEQTPTFEHDCVNCIFLDTVHGHYEEEDTHDLYYCDGEPTVVARYGNAGYEYRSGLEFAKGDHVLLVAKNLAIEKELMKLTDDKI